MFKEIIGFLTEKGWEGVENIYLLVGIGVGIGMWLIYYFLVYIKEDMPKRITIRSHLTKIVLLLALLVFILTFKSPIDN